MAFTDYIYPQGSQAEDIRQQMLMAEQERANQIRLPYLRSPASLNPYAMPSEQAFRGAEVTGMAPSFSAEGKTFFLKPRNQSALIEREKEAARRRGEAFQPIEQSYSYETPSGEKMKGIFMGGPLYMGDGQYLYGTSYRSSPAHGQAGYVEKDGRSYKVGQNRGGYSQEYKERQREEQIGNVSARRPSDLSSQEEKEAYDELMRRRRMAAQQREANRTFVPEQTVSPSGAPLRSSQPTMASQSVSPFRQAIGSLTGFGGVPLYPFTGQY